MKKIMSLILVLTMLISLANFNVTANEGDVIFSDSFEAGLSNWSFGTKHASDANSKLVTDKASDGAKAVYVVDEKEDESYGFKSVKIPVTAGKTYTVNGDIYNVEGMGAKIFFTYVDNGGTRVGNQNQSVSSTGKWETVSITQTAPETAAAIVLILTGSGSGKGKTYIDNIKITEGGSVASSSTSAPAVPDTKAGETVYSTSFEDGLGDWDNYSSKSPQSYESSDADASEGKKSIKIWDEVDSSCGIRSARIPVKTFNKYTLYTDLKAVEGKIKLYFRLYDKDKKQINQKNVVASSKDWTTYKITQETTADTATVEIIIMTESAGTGVFYADNVKIVDDGAGEVDYISAPLQTEINEKLKNAKPGDVIEIPDGEYKNVILNVPSSGTEDKPITLKAKNPGKAVFKKESGLTVTGSYVHIEGLKFEECTKLQIIRFEPDTRYCVLSDCAVINSNPLNDDGTLDTKTTQKWVYIQGKYNKVTGCYFRGKNSVGQMVEIIRREAEADYHIVENCYFGDFKLNGGNGYETFRIGTSQQSLSGSYSILKGCFFEKCNGEGEAISIKSCNNTLINNTLYNTQGAIVLRHGNDNYIEGNLFIGGEKTSRPTGVRVIGEKHKVLNNYFYNLPETSTAVYIMDTNPNPLIHEYLEIKDIDVSNNTFINVDNALMLGEYLPSDVNSSSKVIPPHGNVSNNAIISYKGDLGLVPNKEPNRKLTLSNNVCFGKDIGYEGELPSGLSYGEIDYEVVDKFVQTKGIGADINKVKAAPKSPFDVMPEWVKKEYYDTGKFTFDVVKGDPFNTDMTPDKILPKKGVVNVTINGYRKEFDVDPQLINSRTMVPMRAIFEEFGALVTWDETTATATAVAVGTEIKITENSDIAYVNGNEMKLDSPAVIIDGRFLVPLRFISESFGAQVGWIDPAQTATIVFEDRSNYIEFASKHGIINPIPVKSYVQSGDDGTNTINNVVDGNIGTKWAVRDNLETKELGYGIFDLGKVMTLDKFYIAFSSSNTRIYDYDVLVSEDGVNFTTVIENASTKNFLGEFEGHDLKGVSARYVKYVGRGNNENAWNNPSEIIITGK